MRDHEVKLLATNRPLSDAGLAETLFGTPPEMFLGILLDYTEVLEQLDQMPSEAQEILANDWGREFRAAVLREEPGGKTPVVVYRVNRAQFSLAADFNLGGIWQEERRGKLMVGHYVNPIGVSVYARRDDGLLLPRLEDALGSNPPVYIMDQAKMLNVAARLHQNSTRQAHSVRPIG